MRTPGTGRQIGGQAMQHVGILAGLAAVGLLWACAPEERLPSGAQLYGDYCAACHGADARGSGPVASGVGVPVPDLTTLSARNGGVFPLVRVMSKVDGYARGESPGRAVMPELGHLLDGPLVRVDTGDGRMTPTPAKLIAIAEYIEGVQR